MAVPDLKLLIHNCFGVMMMRGLLNSNESLFRALKSISMYLKIAHEYSDVEIHQVLMHFFAEYNKGCNPPMPTKHIEDVIIPAVLNYNEFDINLGPEIIDTAINAIIATQGK